MLSSSVVKQCENTNNIFFPESKPRQSDIGLTFQAKGNFRWPSEYQEHHSKGRSDSLSQIWTILV